MRALNEVGRFVLELLALAAFGFGAAQLADGAVRFLPAAVAVLAAAALWGVLVAPKSSRRLADPARLALEVVFFVAAGAALVASGWLWVGVALGLLGSANAASLRLHEPVLGALE